ncbi:hypothetical protein TNCT_150121 [Trichonephila clavata]|uniref:Uncharacterized protein n=1 Tax=Trichonephila clavata TaxID=2740835 RepID=A0A8X6L047_TRICU|nr:hypothetical protein TNCT_150121 [Trichonephila clavata]
MVDQAKYPRHNFLNGVPFFFTLMWFETEAKLHSVSEVGCFLNKETARHVVSFTLKDVQSFFFFFQRHVKNALRPQGMKIAHEKDTDPLIR